MNSSYGKHLIVVNKDVALSTTFNKRIAKEVLDTVLMSNDYTEIVTSNQTVYLKKKDTLEDQLNFILEHTTSGDDRLLAKTYLETLHLHLIDDVKTFITKAQKRL